MISKERFFGAPVMDPGGKHALMASTTVAWGRSSPVTVETNEWTLCDSTRIKEGTCTDPT